MRAPRVYIAQVVIPSVLLLCDRATNLALGAGWTRIDAVDGAALTPLAERAWYWPEAASVLARATCGWRFTLSAAAPTPLDAALLATAEATKAARDAAVIAVVWEMTGLAHDPASFVDQAADANGEDVPLYLWVRFEGKKDADGTLGMRTTGLAALGAMEVEVAESARDGEHILECVTDVALFLVTTDHVPDDGDTIDVTQGTLRVRRMPSLRGDGSMALRVRV